LTSPNNNSGTRYVRSIAGDGVRVTKPDIARCDTFPG